MIKRVFIKKGIQKKEVYVPVTPTRRVISPHTARAVPTRSIAFESNVLPRNGAVLVQPASTFAMRHVANANPRPHTLPWPIYLVCVCVCVCV